MSDKQTVLITGCSSGMGKLAAKTFHDKGWNVVATMRTPEKETELTQLDDVLVTRLDVSDVASVEAAVNEALERFGAIDVLVNNAGYGGHAMLEQMPDAEVRKMYDTNVFGVMNTCRAVLPHMRQRKQGVVVNVTSMAGVIGLAAESAYSSSKWAVEGFTECIDLEYKLLGVRARSVAPGAYLSTDFGGNANDAYLETGDEELQAFTRRLREHFMQSVKAEGGETADPQEVADMIYACATTDMPVHNPCGKDAQFLMSLSGGPPRQEWLDKIEPLLLPSS